MDNPQSSNCLYSSTLGSIQSISDTIENRAVEEDTVSIHTLNDDCLRILFSHISRNELYSQDIQLVCKRWFCLTNSIIFRREKLSFFIGKPEERFDEDPSRRSFFIGRTEYRLDEDVILIGKTLFSLVQALYFSKEKVSELSLESTYDDKLPCSEMEPHLIAIKELCPHLAKLSINKYIGFYKVEPEDIPFPFPSNLRELTITSTWMKDHVMSHILKQSSATLEKLKLSRCLVFKNSGASIMENLQSCNMIVLDLSRCYRLNPQILPFVLSTYQETLEEFHFTSTLIKPPFPEGIVMKKLKSVTLYEIYRDCGIEKHDEEVVLRLFKAMVNVEDLTILTDDHPMYPRFETCEFVHYLGKIMMLKNLKNLTLPLEPMRHKIFGDHSYLNYLRDLGVMVRINSQY